MWEPERMPRKNDVSWIVGYVDVKSRREIVASSQGTYISMSVCFTSAILSRLFRFPSAKENERNERKKERKKERKQCNTPRLAELLRPVLCARREAWQARHRGRLKQRKKWDDHATTISGDKLQ